ncbi:MAG: helix-turn-helix domain-containing protein [Alistipes sp.]|nr:helix-turn-helix domain-containing protein [Alistipes sp.]
MTGKQLKQKIKQKGIKFTTLAEMLDVVPQQVQQYFNANNVSTDVVERIAEVIGESVSYFYNEYPILTIEDYNRVVTMEKEIVYLRQLLDEKERLIEVLIKKEE